MTSPVIRKSILDPIVLAEKELEYEEERIRTCYRCSRVITACMGFVLARDYLSCAPKPRELCGVCVFIEEEKFGKGMYRNG